MALLDSQPTLADLRTGDVPNSLRRRHVLLHVGAGRVVHPLSGGCRGRATTPVRTTLANLFDPHSRVTLCPICPIPYGDSLLSGFTFWLQLEHAITLAPKSFSDFWKALKILRTLPRAGRQWTADQGLPDRTAAAGRRAHEILVEATSSAGREAIATSFVGPPVLAAAPLNDTPARQVLAAAFTVASTPERVLLRLPVAATSVIDGVSLAPDGEYSSAALDTAINLFGEGIYEDLNEALRSAEALEM